MKVEISEDKKHWNWKEERKGIPHGKWHDYHGQTMEQLEKTAQREWQHDLDLYAKFEKS